eukprot:TRINITY_DN7038_c0_g1_i1.p1 TRINITY_DN7038_c0_g1~~TRINITY_DN7038_c0_g1_i1.p1  ORF type:complete len:188 (+),score=13.76 TRINITY_DN7038_c0_g1_i1:270-833(+)
MLVTTKATSRLCNLTWKRFIPPGISNLILLTFNILIRSFASTNQIDAAMDLLPAIQAYGLSPTVETYTYLIELCGSNKHLNAVKYLVGNMQSQGIVENREFFIALIVAYTKNAAIDKAVLTFAEMRDWKTHDFPLTLLQCLRFLNMFLDGPGKTAPSKLSSQAKVMYDKLLLLSAFTYGQNDKRQNE